MPHTRSPPTRRRTRWASILTLGSLLATSWLPYAQAKSAADYYVQSLPGAPEPLLKMYAGHIEITPEHHGNLFFWLFKNKHIANRQRTVFWFNGGPGCSSMDGALMEVGPYRVNEDGTLRLQDGSWDEFANIVFVDQPVGTGFSYADTNAYVHELKEDAEQMIKFFDEFFAIFPEHAHDDIYLAGESYAGQWIPYTAAAILDRNFINPQSQWNLSGLLIGNGWIHGPEQYISYIPYAYEAGLIKAGDQNDLKLQQDQKKCLEDLQNADRDYVDMGSCENILQDLLRLTKDDEDNCFNMYDTRLTDVYPSCGMNWPPDLHQVEPYLRRSDVLKALHINADKKTGWVECSGQVSSAFTARNSTPSGKLLPALLEKIPILLFSGDKDMICNHIGTENVINNLEWNGAVGMEMAPGVTAPKQDWAFEGEPAGQYQTARNLTYLRFYNSSHMVPFDYPRRSRDMLDRFMGVDIASIGGKPADSRIDGEKVVEVSVGGHPNSTVAQQEEEDKLQAVTWDAYRRSGEAALVVVLIAAGAWGFFLWRDRRRRAGYRGVMGSDPYDRGHSRSMSEGLGLDVRSKSQRDVEAARDFNEAELDDVASPNGHAAKPDSDNFDLADEEDEDDGPQARTNGHAA